jgi:hypothetical protein
MQEVNRRTVFNPNKTLRKCVQIICKETRQGALAVIAVFAIFALRAIATVPEMMKGLGRGSSVVAQTCATGGI